MVMSNNRMLIAITKFVYEEISEVKSTNFDAR